MTTEYRCYCGAPAEIGFSTDHGVEWRCATHAPWVCIGCGPEDGDEDNYADAPKFQEDQQ